MQTAQKTFLNVACSDRFPEEMFYSNNYDMTYTIWSNVWYAKQLISGGMITLYLILYTIISISDLFGAIKIN